MEHEGAKRLAVRLGIRSGMQAFNVSLKLHLLLNARCDAVAVDMLNPNLVVIVDGIGNLRNILGLLLLIVLASVSLGAILNPRSGDVPAIRETQRSREQLDMPGVRLICEAIPGNPQHAVEQPDLFEVIRMLPEPPSKFDIKVLLEGGLVFVQHLWGSQSCKVVSVDYHGDAPLRMPETTRARFALNKSCSDQ